MVAFSTVVSSDGVDLGLIRSGTGAPVVLVHGTMGSVGDWHEVSRRLSIEFEVIAYDRRGRGGSGDGDDPAYSLDREVDDLLTVVDASGPPVTVIGHSFGAIVSILATARAGDKVRRLIVYEPPIGEVDESPDALPAELTALVEAGNLDAAIERFADAAGLTAAELRASRAKPQVWAALRGAVPTAAREIRAAHAVLPLPDHTLRRVEVPTLVLLGSDQDHPTYSGVRDLVDRLPLGTFATVAGHHMAIVSAPDSFADTVRAFLRH